MKAESLNTKDSYSVVSDGMYFPFLSYFKAVKMIVEYIDDGFIRVELINQNSISKFMRYPIGLFNSMGENFPYRTNHNA